MNDRVELERWSDLEAIWNNAWSALVRGGADRKDAFHTMSVATLGVDSARGLLLPRVRTVVLRKTLPETATLLFHTDTRSAKTTEMTVHPQCSLLLYDPKRQMQIRLEALATLHTADALADEHWANSFVLSRKCYCGEAVPGAESDVMTSGLPNEIAGIAGADFDEQQSSVGRKHFAVVECSVYEMEWLCISPDGHRRARFSIDAASGVLSRSVWLVP
jgi:pyridoxamine 5'-phosphate oxidase